MISVPYLIHILLHIIRLIEFQYLEDLFAIAVLKGDKSLFKSNLKDVSLIIEKLVETLTTGVVNNEKFLKRKKTFIKSNQKILRELHIKKLNPILQDTFSQTMTWTNIDYPIKPIVIFANRIKTTKDLVLILKKESEIFFKENSSYRYPKNWKTNYKNLHNYMFRYLTGNQALKSLFFGWALQNPNRTMLTCQKEFLSPKKKKVIVQKY